MARSSRRLQATSLVALLLLSLPLTTDAQLTSVPNLSTATTDTTGATSAKTTAKSTQQTTGQTTGKTTDQTTGQTTQDAQSSTTANRGGIPNPTGSFTGVSLHLTGAPTIAGAGIPTLVIPFTANAPFMKKSSLPQGTFFIAVGAVLAFMGACILLWRGMVAWSMNRSIKRTAMLASMTSEKHGGRTTSSYWGGSTAGGYNRMASSGGKSTGGGAGYYKDAPYESAVSLDNLTSTGKPVKPHFRDSVAERNSSSAGAPLANLFFSPTAQAASQRDSSQQTYTQHRNSGYMPSGYYASPSAQAGGGNANIAIGGNLAPGSYGNTNRYSAASGPSPPSSPGLPPQSRGSYRNSASRDGAAYRASSRDGLRAQSRDGLASQRNSAYLYAQPSHSSLMVGGQSGSEVGTSRAPSAYLDELFDNHGSGPRERF